MNFQQLRAAREALRQGLNLTDVARALHTSQPGVSRQILELEDTLGVSLFVRQGRRLTGLTPEGEALLPQIGRVLDEIENLKRLGADLRDGDRGVLRLAATHTQARYALPAVIRDFRQRYPEVTLQLHQGTPAQIAQLVLDEQADLGIATESLAEHAGLVALPAYVWSHCVVVPRGHALTKKTLLSLHDLSAEPLITYEPGFTGRRGIDQAFAAAGVPHQIALEAMDSDVIKTYVGLGLGVGIIASLAFDEDRDSDLIALDARHLFALNTTRIGIKRGLRPRQYACDFVTLFAPPLTREVILAALD